MGMSQSVVIVLKPFVLDFDRLHLNKRIYFKVVVLQFSSS